MIQTRDTRVQADDLGCKVYCGPVDTESIKSENDTRHSASVATSVIELKSTPSHVSAPDVSSIHVSGGHASPSSSANTWNLPDLLIGFKVSILLLHMSFIFLRGGAQNKSFRFTQDDDINDRREANVIVT